MSEFDLARAICSELDIDYLIGVPDSRVSPVVEACAQFATVEVAPREDLAMAAAFGYALSGRRPAVYMKDAGLGHCLDALLTTFGLTETSLLLLVGTAGTETFAPPHHSVWRDVCGPLLTLLGFEVVYLSSPVGQFAAGLLSIGDTASAHLHALVLVGGAA